MLLLQDHAVYTPVLSFPFSVDPRTEEERYMYNVQEWSHNTGMGTSVKVAPFLSKDVLEPMLESSSPSWNFFSVKWQTTFAERRYW